MLDQRAASLRRAYTVPGLLFRFLCAYTRERMEPSDGTVPSMKDAASRYNDMQTWSTCTWAAARRLELISRR